MVENIGSKPWVSFCISTYKRPEMLLNQVRSLLRQTFRDFEIVISDNDTNSSLENELKALDDKRISYQVNPENLGMVKSFNRSLERSKGEFVVMITDDDPVHEDMLETLHEIQNKYPGYGAYYGGCDIKCYSSFAAHVMRAKVGMNSCLSSEMDYGEIRTFSKEEFPILFLEGKIGSLLLWSVGIIRREILIENGGMPDYGTEFFTDHAYNLVNGSHSGLVLINKSLGHQAIHGNNFGFTQLKQFDKYSNTPIAFTNWVTAKLGQRKDWDRIRPRLYEFTGRAFVEFSVFIDRSLKGLKLPDGSFKTARAKVFKTDFLKKWRLKYILLTRYPKSFHLLLQLKSLFNKN